MKKLIIFVQGNHDCFEMQDENDNSVTWCSLTAQEQQDILNAISNIYGTLEANAKEGGAQ